MAAFDAGRQTRTGAPPPLPGSTAGTRGIPVHGGAVRRTPFADGPTGRAVHALRTGKPVAVGLHPDTVSAATATGRGGCARVCADKYGSPRLRSSGTGRSRRRAPGDSVRAALPPGRAAGARTGRVPVRVTGSCSVRTRHGNVQGIHHRRFRLLQRADGHAYTTQKEAGATSPGLQAGVTVPYSR